VLAGDVHVVLAVQIWTTGVIVEIVTVAAVAQLTMVRFCGGFSTTLPAPLVTVTEKLPQVTWDRSNANVPVTPPIASVRLPVSVIVAGLNVGYSRSVAVSA
jgi:hypothetical protein